MGHIGILNVGAGDTRLVFDKSKPAEMIRAARIVTDMLKRGYALLIEVPDGKGGTTYTRVKKFRADTCEYIIADLDPDQAQRTRGGKNAQGKSRQAASAESEGATEGAAEHRAAKPNLRERAVDASSTRGIAVARSAGG